MKHSQLQYIKTSKFVPSILGGGYVRVLGSWYKNGIWKILRLASAGGLLLLLCFNTRHRNEA